MLSPMSARVGALLAGVLLFQGGLQATLAQDPPPIRIAVVDLEAVFVQSNSGQALQAKLKKFQEEVQVEDERMSQEAQDVRRRAVEGGQSLTVEKLTELQKEFEDKTIAIRRFRDDKKREAEKMKNEGLRDIEQQLEPVFKAIRDERGYDLILNNVPGIVVMANENVDITKDIVDRLNASGG